MIPSFNTSNVLITNDLIPKAFLSVVAFESILSIKTWLIIKENEELPSANVMINEGQIGEHKQECFLLNEAYKYFKLPRNLLLLHLTMSLFLRTRPNDKFKQINIRHEVQRFPFCHLVYVRRVRTHFFKRKVSTFTFQDAPISPTSSARWRLHKCYSSLVLKVILSHDWYLKLQ